MKRDIEWTDRLEDGVKRTVRVTINSKGKGEKVFWRFKKSGEEKWSYDTPPTEQDWAVLEDKVAGRYNRRTATFEEVGIVQAFRKKHG